jgi:hypothetical protein
MGGSTTDTRNETITATLLSCISPVRGSPPLRWRVFLSIENRRDRRFDFTQAVDLADVIGVCIRLDKFAGKHKRELSSGGHLKTYGSLGFRVVLLLKGDDSPRIWSDRNRYPQHPGAWTVVHSEHHAKSQRAKLI